eukprot:5049722-Karenia_brevis.AAC.1
MVRRQSEPAPCASGLAIPISMATSPLPSAPVRISAGRKPVPGMSPAGSPCCWVYRCDFFGKLPCDIGMPSRALRLGAAESMRTRALDRNATAQLACDNINWTCNPQ